MIDIECKMFFVGFFIFVIFLLNIICGILKRFKRIDVFLCKEIDIIFKIGVELLVLFVCFINVEFDVFL